MSTRTKKAIKPGEIKRWMVIGPFASDTTDEDFISRTQIDPNEIFYQQGRQIKWQSWYESENCPDSSLFKDFTNQGYFNTYYLVNYLYSVKEIKAKFHFETNCWLECVLNGEKEFTSDDEIESDNVFLCTLIRGWNVIFVKCILDTSCSEKAELQAFVIREDGNKIEFLLIKNGFVLPDDTETHLFGKNPDDPKQFIEVGDQNTEHLRSHPDFVVYRPRENGKFNDGDNEHFLVTKSPQSNMLLAFWTQGYAEAYGDNHIMMSRSSNHGTDWSQPQFITGTTLGGNETQASWAVPVCSSSGRIYLLYTKSDAGTICGLSGTMGVMQSDNEGQNWIHGPDVEIPTTRIHPEDENSPVTGVFIPWQLPIRDSKGRQILPYSMWKNNRGGCFLMRFDNIEEGPDAKDLKFTWLPNNYKPVEMPVYLKERECCEPSVVLLPDSRLFMTMRTMTGYIWYSVSDDDGHTWREPEVLRKQDFGDKIIHPLSCCPIYAMQNGKFILLHNNNKYFADRYYSGKKFPAGMNMFTNRRPLFASVGRFVSKAKQPIWFDNPRKILDNDGVIVGPKATNEIGTYPSLTECNGKRVLWYPDRKYYLLGKFITDEILGL